MLERTKHLKNRHGSSQLSPVAKPTKTICYQLGKINVEVERVAIFVDLQQCSIEDMTASVCEGEKATLNVILKDTEGKPICNAADIFTAAVTTTSNNVIPSSVKELGDGKYSVSFSPSTPVEHIIYIQINGIDIASSPMKTLISKIPL